jgi:hypothetical protein
MTKKQQFLSLIKNKFNKCSIFWFITILIILVLLVKMSYQSIYKEKFYFNDSKDILNKRNRLLVIGDIHADFNLFKHILVKSKLINNKEEWIAKPKDTVIVQVGDLLDGGGRFSQEVYGEKHIMELINKINKQARKLGGGFYPILGNHELMNVYGDFKYASKKDIDDTGGRLNRTKLYKPGGQLAKNLSKHSVILKVGSYLFCHAGILLEHVDNPNTIHYLNNLMRKYLNNNLKHGEEYQFNKYFSGDNSLLWNREYGKDNVNGETCKNLDILLNKLGCKSMIIGHTPQEHINNQCQGKVWRVDVGISRCFSMNENNLQILEILDDGKKINILDVKK